jgi:hypothetical protein
MFFDTLAQLKYVFRESLKTKTFAIPVQAHPAPFKENCMGHYASEMACSTCHQCRCICPPPPDTTREHWVVDVDYSVMQAHLLEAKYSFIAMPFGRIPDKGMGHMRRMACTHFPTKEEAEAHALVRLQTALAKSQEETANLAARLKELQAA